MAISLKIAIILIALLIAGIFAISGQLTQATIVVTDGPLYTRGDGHYLVFHLKFMNGCWEEIYARATPKYANQVVLNKFTIENTNPGNYPMSEYVKKVPFDGKKIERIAQEQKARAYVVTELPGLLYYSDYQYKPYLKDQLYYHFHFYIKTELQRCMNVEMITR